MEAIMQVSKWGNSLAVRLPKALVEEFGIVEGDDLDIRQVDNQTFAMIRSAKDREFVIHLRRLQKPTPPGYRWSRDEANTR
jgi:antitoxin MazE